MCAQDLRITYCESAVVVKSGLFAYKAPKVKVFEKVLGNRVESESIALFCAKSCNLAQGHLQSLGIRCCLSMDSFAGFN
jgi:hypothetical protein